MIMKFNIILLLSWQVDHRFDCSDFAKVFIFLSFQIHIHIVFFSCIPSWSHLKPKLTRFRTHQLAFYFFDLIEFYWLNCSYLGRMEEVQILLHKLYAIIIESIYATLTFHLQYLSLLAYDKIYSYYIFSFQNLDNSL